jgi:hypothetical protein
LPQGCQYPPISYNKFLTGLPIACEIFARRLLNKHAKLKKGKLSAIPLQNIENKFKN